MANPSFMYDEGGNAIGVSADKQPPLVIPPEMRNLPNAPSAPAQAPLVMPKGQLPTERQTMPGQSAAPLNIPGDLQRALRTTQGPSNRSVIPPANNVARPAALAQPQAPGMPTPDQMVNDPAFLQQLSKAGPKDIGTMRAEEYSLTNQAAKEEANAKIAEASSIAKAEKSRTQLMQEQAQQQKETIEQHKRDLQEASPFAPTQETAKDIAGLFSLITVAAFGSGGKGKYSGMQTLASLTGAMKGYQAGQKDVFEKDIKNFEENLKVLKTHNDKVNALYEDAMKLMSTNKELGLQKIQELRAVDNNGIAAQLARSGQYKALGELLNKNSIAIQAAKDKADKLNNDFAKLSVEHRYRMEESQAKIVGKVDREVLNEATKFYPDLKPENLTNLSKQGTDRIVNSVETIKSIEEVAKYIKQHPQAVGATAKIKNLINFDAIKSITGDDKASADAKAKIIDSQIDDAIKQGKLNTDEARNAKVLNKMIFAVALQDVRSSGQRGSVYLDKSFQNLYDQASQVSTLADILDARIKESDRRLEVVDMNIVNRSDRDKFELATKGGEQWMNDNFPMITPTDLKKRLANKSLKSGDWIRKTDGTLAQIN